MSYPFFLLNSMLFLLVTWVVVAGVQAGWGFLVTRLWQSHDGTSWQRAFWVGFGVLLVFLQLWHLFLPITPMTTAIVVLIGAGGVLIPVQKSGWRGIVASLPAWGWLAVIGGVAFLAANHALKAPIFYDNGLYHLPTIQWVQRYALVPGLANLYGPYAFNSSYFLGVALWDGVIEAFMGAQILHGMLTLALVIEGVQALAHAFATRRLRPSSLFAILLLYPVINLMFDPLAHYLSGPTPDYPVWLLSLKLGMEGVRFLESPTSEMPRFWSIVLLALVLITIKLSGAVFAAGLLLILLLKVWQREGRLSKSLLIPLTVLGMLTIAPWMVRSAFLSGYLLYPTTFGGLPVAWRVADEQAIEDTNDVRAWSRYPVVGSRWQEVLGNWEWFPSWRGDFWRTRGIKAAIVLGASAWGMVLLPAGVRRRLPSAVRRLLWWSLPSIAALLFWFFTAPSVRYAPPYLWLLAMGGVVALYESFPLGKSRMARFLAYRAAPLLAAGAILLLTLFSFGGQWQSERGRIPTTEVRPFSTLSGLILYVPTADELCWNAPLPCTPYPNANLRLREAGNLGGGFTVEPP